ncbi:MAG: acyclic terpene utilization AtuA family protein [Proteobacteria bacterium]|nr:acyclic terpene utilization AtuA family protein [Pseudomonadota bacterium]
MKELRCLSATGQLGHGILRDAFARGVANKPDYIGADMGSTDIGPFYLGAGETESETEMIRRDLALVLQAGRKLGVPLVIGSAGSAGARPHLERTLDVLFEVARRHRLSFRLAVIRADVGKDYLLGKLRAGKVRPCGPVPDLTPERIARAERMVGQMGMEPFMKALDGGAEVVVAGRSCDAAVFAALPVWKGYDAGLAMHLAKIVECASFATEPGGRDAIMGYLRDDHFIIESMNPRLRATPYSVAAHSLYEQPDPFEVVEPGGRLDLSRSRFEALDERRTRVSGSRWEPSPTYTVKIEGVEKTGHRVISIGAVRCPIAVGQIKDICRRVGDLTASILEGDIDPADYRLKFRTYGVDGAMGEGERERNALPIEVAVITDVVGKSEQIAKSVCSVARYYLLHFFYDGILATAGNVAVPFVPCDIPAGPAYEFSVYHLVEVDDPLELFPIEYLEVREGAAHA